MLQVRSCWDSVITQAQVAERQKAIQEFNKENRWRKRGLAVLPTMFGMPIISSHLVKTLDKQIPNQVVCLSVSWHSNGHST